MVDGSTAVAGVSIAVITLIISLICLAWILWHIFAPDTKIFGKQPFRGAGYRYSGNNFI